MLLKTLGNAETSRNRQLLKLQYSSFAERTHRISRPKCIMRIQAVAIVSMAASQLSAVVVFDSINPSSGSATYVTAAQTPRSSFADDFSLSSNVQITAIQFGFATTVNNRIFDARFKFYGTVDYSATGTNLAMSNPMGNSVTVNIQAGNAGNQFSNQIDLSNANIFLNAGTRGFSIEFFEPGSLTYITNDQVTPLLSAFTPSVGSSQNIHVREGSPGVLNGFFEGNEIRIPSSERYVAVQMNAVPEPATLAILATGFLNFKIRRNRDKCLSCKKTSVA